MKALIRTEFPTSAQDAWHIVKQSKTLVYICKGLLSFDGSDQFPKEWQQDQTIHTRLRFFGFVPGWKHALRFLKVSDEDMTILTQEQGGAVKVWNHEIKVENRSDNRCVYTDTVEIQAGILTPFVWLYANTLYRYRQRRWKHLLPKP